MAKNVVGIDISDFSIEALALEKKKGGFKVESYARFRLSPEIVDDGRILDKQKLKDAILKMFANAKPIPFNQSRKVFLSIPESQTFSRVLSLPKNIKDKDLKKIAIDKAEEIIPESIDRLTALVKVLPDTDNHKHIFYSAAETEVVKNFINIFKELDIEVAGITTETVSSFAGLKKNKDKKNILLLDLGARTTIASIFIEECLCSSININIGGENITKAIVNKLNISYSQAEDKKKQIGLSSDGDGETMLISQGQLQPLVDELKVFIKYWQETNKKTIEQVILVGGLSQMKGADKYFGDNLNLSTQLGWPFIDAKDLPAGFIFSKYINALGLAKLAHKGTDVDFYKKLSKEKKAKDKKESGDSKFSKKSIISIILIIILFLVAGAMFIFRNQLTTLIYPNNQEQEIIQPKIEVEPEPKIEVEPEILKITERIFVSTAEDISKDNFILGEIYSFSVDKSLLDPGLSYTDLLANLHTQSDTGVLIELADEYDREEYYTIPKILVSQLGETDPLEAAFLPGNELKVSILYSFLSFKMSDLEAYVSNKNPELQDKIIGAYYKILGYQESGANYSFDLEAVVQYQ